RHFSKLIAHVIENELISLGLYDKLVTITCDGASNTNMRDMFNYFNRTNITYICCIAHKLHLVICYSLNLWVKEKKRRISSDIEEIVEGDTDEDDDEDDIPIRLIQMIIIMKKSTSMIKFMNFRLFFLKSSSDEQLRVFINITVIMSVILYYTITSNKGYVGYVNEDCYDVKENGQLRILL
ncbi:unnamed protein product, partial [Rotaria sp. Silwood2]